MRRTVILRSHHARCIGVVSDDLQHRTIARPLVVVASGRRARHHSRACVLEGVMNMTKFLIVWFGVGLAGALGYQAEVQRQCGLTPSGRQVAMGALFAPLIIAPIFNLSLNCEIFKR